MLARHVVHVEASLGDDAVGVVEFGRLDSAEADPALHSGIAPVAAAIETVSPLDHADATLAAGAPFLAVAEPALLLLAFALGALGRAIGDADALDALGFRDRLVFGRVETGIRRHQVRGAPSVA